MKTSIQAIEAAILNGEYPEPVERFRVYAMTTSPVHLKAGSSFYLHSSFHNLADAKAMAEEINSGIIEIAVVID